VWCAREIYALRVFSILQILISRCRAWKQRLQFFIDLLQTLKRFHAATLPMDRYETDPRHPLVKRRLLVPNAGEISSAAMSPSRRMCSRVAA
jgi:hypothetical protein